MENWELKNRLTGIVCVSSIIVILAIGSCLVIISLQIIHLEDLIVSQEIKETPNTTITLDHLDQQCELTFWTRKGPDTFVPVKMPTDDIIYQIKGSDEVPNGLYPSYYQVKGLELNGKPVYAITGFMPEKETKDWQYCLKHFMNIESEG